MVQVQPCKEAKTVIIPWTKAGSDLPDYLYVGCDFGRWLDEEVIIDFDPETKTADTLCSLFHPVLPQPLPIELKGIAV